MENAVAVATPAEVKAIETKTGALVERAQAFVVNSADSFGLAGQELVAIKGLQKEVNATFDPIVSKAYELYKEAGAQKKKHSEPLEAAEKLYKGKMATWEEEERRRLAEEARRREEEKRRQEEEAEEERRRQAAELEAAGLHETAAAILAEPSPAPEPEPEPVPEAPQAAGVSFRYNYSAEVVDFMALVKAVVAGQAPAALLLPNQPALNQMAKAMKDELQIAGVKVKKDRVVSARA